MLFSCRKYFILDLPSRKLPSALFYLLFFRDWNAVVRYHTIQCLLIFCTRTTGNPVYASRKHLVLTKKCFVYCQFSLSHHHQSHSTNKVKNQRDKKRWIFKQSRKDPGLWNDSCRRYSKKSFTQIYKALYGDAMFVPHWGEQIWLPEANKKFCYKKPVVGFWGLINIHMSTYPHKRTV